MTFTREPIAFMRCWGKHGECPGVYALCDCGWHAEYPSIRHARYYAALHGDACEDVA